MTTQAKLFQYDDSSDFDSIVRGKREMIKKDPSMMIQALMEAVNFKLLPDECLGQAAVDFVGGHPSTLLSAIAGIVDWYAERLADGEFDYMREQAN